MGTIRPQSQPQNRFTVPLTASQQNQSEFLPLYIFLPCKYGIDDIKKNRLKVSMLDELNDPYEAMPCFVDQAGECCPSEYVRSNFLSPISRKAGIICFSGKSDDPVLWAHYADKHRGVAFEFVFPRDEMPQHVTYVDKRVVVNISEKDEIKTDYMTFYEKLIFSKWSSWKYEDEYRLLERTEDLVRKEQKGKVLYFKQPIPIKSFRRIILGWKCKVKANRMRHILDTSGFGDVLVATAKVNDSEFSMSISECGCGGDH